MSAPKILPAWAPRLSQAKVRRFYENDARGLYDEALIDEVGYALLARCESFIEANEAVQGRARCPLCNAVILHPVQKEAVLRCAEGHWELSWAEYFETIQHRQLSGAEPVLELFRDYVLRFPQARSPQEKVYFIDRLIHGFHWFIKTGQPTLSHPTRPVAVNLIQGKLREVMAFLDSLSCGETNTPGLQENRAEWEKNIETARGWYKR
jgi:hypothetical protein